jgi:hypothetical protein
LPDALIPASLGGEKVSEQCGCMCNQVMIGT